MINNVYVEHWLNASTAYKPGEFNLMKHKMINMNCSMDLSIIDNQIGYNNVTLRDHSARIMNSCS